MQRRSTTIMLIIKASRVLQEMVGVLFEPENSAAMRALGTDVRRMASCRTRAASSRSELEIAPCGLVNDNKSEVTSAGKGYRQTIL